MTTKREFDEDDLVKTRTLNFRQSSDAWFGIDVIYGIRQLPDGACQAMNHRARIDGHFRLGQVRFATFALASKRLRHREPSRP